MAITLKPKRSATAAKVPTTTDLTSGELGVNMTDRKIYINNGTAVVQVGAGLLSALGDVNLAGLATGNSISWNGTAWVASAAGSGTVTSVALSLPSIFTVSGSPVTTSGTLTASLASQAANLFLAAPNGAAGVPTFRAIAAADIPTLNQNTTGSAATLTTARTIGMTGDVSWTSASFNGSANVTGTATLANSGVTAGTYTKITVDAKGRATAGTTLVAADIPELTMAKLPGAAYKQSVRCATTANITLSGTQTIDGIAVVAGDRVLVKNQTAAAENGIYVASAGTWTRSLDADASDEIGAAVVNIDLGTANGGELWTTTFRTTDTLGTTAMSWFEVLYNSGTWSIGISGNAGTATTLQTARTIALSGAVTGTATSFNGSANITIPTTVSTTQGGVVYGGSATAYATTAAGTAGFLLASNGTSAPTWVENSLLSFPGSTFKKSVRVATTAALTLNTAQTVIDGVTIVATDRVLVKNQATAAQNGIYTGLTTTSWVRAVDADTSAEIGSAIVAIDEGTANGGEVWTTTFKPTDTLGTTAMNWFEMLYNTGTWGISISGSAATLTTGRTIALTGDVTYTSGSFNGSANVTGTATLAASGVTAGTYTKVTVDAKGRVTAGTTLASADLPTYTGTLTSTQITTGLGFTPYNATNPSGYTSNTGTVTSVSGTGTVSGLSLSGTVTGSGSLTLGGSITGFLPTSGGNVSGLVNFTNGRAQTQSAGLAMWEMHIPGAHARAWYLDTSGITRLATTNGAGTASTVQVSVDGSSNMSVAGNVTANSDERLKTNWRDLAGNFLEQLAGVRHGIYDRTDLQGLTQVGVSAQSMQRVLSQSVLTGADGILSVNYGNAALVAAIALAKRVLQLEARIEHLETNAA